MALAPAVPVAKAARPAPSAEAERARERERSRRIEVQQSDTRIFMGAPPADWQAPAFDDRPWAGKGLAGPFLPRAPILGPPAASKKGTSFDVVPGGSLFLRRRFDLAEPERVRVLELRVSYSDGFIAYLNGREVARRGIPAGSDPHARPELPHTREPETIYLPVSAATTGTLRARENLVAVEIRATLAGSLAVAPVTPFGNVEVAAAAGVRIVRGPYLIAPAERGGKREVSVAWETDLPARGTVYLEPQDVGEKPRQIRSGGPSLRQVVALKGLLPGKGYRYSVTVVAGKARANGKGEAAAGNESASYLMQTLPDRHQPIRFVVYGDMRGPGHAAHAEVIAAVVREKPPLVINTGDLVAVGSEESNWQRYFEISAPLGAIAPVVPALGNHDVIRAGRGAAKTWQLFGMGSPSPKTGGFSTPGWTSFDLAGIHFVILDSNQMGSAGQKSWLAADLARARAARPRAIFAFAHDNAWAHGPHGGSEVMEREYAPMLAKGGVDVLFGGHDHLYERGQGMTSAGPLPYVVTGGGGAPLYNPTCQAAGGPPPGNVPGPLPACPSTVAAVVKTFHYLVVEVSRSSIEICPRRPDGAPVEPCIAFPLRGTR
jgi:hypothetical protein